MDDSPFPAAWRSPKATVNGSYLSLNQPAYALLGEPEAVSLAFESDSGRILMTPATTEAESALRVRAPHRDTGRSSPNPSIYIAGFARQHGIATSRQSYTVRLHGQSLVLTPYRERTV